jgi:class 3 adenylate cyclase
MEHRIRFATSDDGVTIASWQVGSGRPLVMATLPGGLWPPSTITANPGARRLYDNLAERHTLLVYDARGGGLSQRDAEDYTLTASSNDLRAVADLYGLERFALLGFRGTAKAAVHFAATHSERVSRMVLRDPVLGRRDQVLPPRERLLQGMIETDFAFFVEAMSLSNAGWETGRHLAEGARHAMTREAFIRARAVFRDEDGWEYVPLVTCPTLVVHSRGTAESYPIDVARRAAAGIPDATFSVIQGASPYDPRDADEFAAVALEFLLDQPAKQPRRQDRTAGTAVILFVDIADSTALTERLGDVAFRARARQLDEALRGIVRDHGGTVIDAKTLGDGILATFPSASKAIGAALACELAGDERALSLHLGLHAGDVIREQGNVYGGAVNIAARVAGLAAPGEVLVSATVRDLARTSAGVRFEDCGEQRLKGVEDAVRVFVVRRT